MVRRLFVPAIVAALTLGVAPSPSFGFGAHEVRPRFDDHYRCMYRCDERGGSFRPTGELSPRPPRPGWGSWSPRPQTRPQPTAGPSWHRPGCWLFCGGGSGPGSWSGPYHWCGPGPYFLDDSYGHRPGRPCRPSGDSWWDRDRYGRYDRYDRYDRDRDRDDDRGYDAHRHHPRGGDF